MNFIVLKYQYQLTRKFKETLNVLNKHTTVNPQVSYQVSFMDPAIQGSHILQLDIKQISMYFLTSVRKNDRIVSSVCFYSCVFFFLTVNISSETGSVCFKELFAVFFNYLKSYDEFQSRRIERDTSANLCPLYDNIVTKLAHCLDCANKSQRPAMCPQSFAYIRIHLSNIYIAHCMQISASYYTNGSRPLISSLYNSGSPFCCTYYHTTCMISDNGHKGLTSMHFTECLLDCFF